VRFVRFICLAFLILPFANPRSFAGDVEKPKLLVLVVFDQMRGDYVERWRPLFEDGGFLRLEKDGAWFTNCHYPYATTATGPGHASMLTGCCPDRHGIINNEWYDTKTATVVNCSESARYQRIPPVAKKAAEEPEKEGKPAQTATNTPKVRVKLAGSPDYLLAPTLGDALKESTGGKARIVGLSFKDRSAILPIGKSADAVYWLDSNDGMIVTSSCYRDSVHPWVAEFNDKRVADQWFGKEWDRLLPNIDYARYSGPDKAPGEGLGVKQGDTFPHPTDGGLKKPGPSYFNALFNSPFGNDMLLELVRRAVGAEHLGRNESTDLLVVSFSSNDAIGHTWGPDSQEVFDTTLRSDRLMAEFLSLLDREVGKGKYVLALTADHGICPLPEVTAEKGRFARRVSVRKLIMDAEEHLRSLFDKEAAGAEQTSKSRWIEQIAPPWIWLNQSLIKKRGLKSADVEKALADFLAKQEGIGRAFTRADLAAPCPPDDLIGTRMKRSYYAERCGDVGMVLTPYCLFGDGGFKTGTNHGTPHPYDTYVPLLVYGTGIKPGIHKEAVTPQAIAAILAKAAGINPPKMAVYPAPEGLFEAPK
jgi:predicted AlkP superfamily pyrophosphatase or phosphodiesterase